uniref:Uncharacterized protein n=1 Tax=Arion vulgaris TaxID=1028688 RepID=A0A0B7BPK6_9EUPU
MHFSLLVTVLIFQVSEFESQTMFDYRSQTADSLKATLAHVAAYLYICILTNLSVSELSL